MHHLYKHNQTYIHAAIHPAHTPTYIIHKTGNTWQHMARSVAVISMRPKIVTLAYVLWIVNGLPGRVGVVAAVPAMVVSTLGNAPRRWQQPMEVRLAKALRMKTVCATSRDVQWIVNGFHGANGLHAALLVAVGTGPNKT